MVKIEKDDDYNHEVQKKKNHTLITIKKKQKLIQLVFLKKLSIYRAANRLKICHPTAKFIIKNYRDTHNIGISQKLQNIRSSQRQISDQKNQSLIVKQQIKSEQNEFFMSIPPTIRNIHEQSVYMVPQWNYYPIFPFYYS